ncbi:MAG: ATP-dependent sacrificial sulfur transferase LarE, partial [Phycisphaerae bacterium]|nr:ATP-dependent sacrificial sulfur transferase LarE [Phycisphaerae bacterium]
VIVAFSGGADSSLLLAMSADTLKAENVLAVMAVSTIFPQRERATAREIVGLLGVKFREIETPQMSDAKFTANPPERCYHCKAMILGRLKELADEGGFAAIVTGTNADDSGDYRPGRRAEEQMGVRCPLAEAGLTKAEIRATAKAIHLPNWNSPAFACLATRIPYGMGITDEKLSRIEQAEDVLRSLGFVQFRVRDHGAIARVEVPADSIEQAASMRNSIADPLKALGYTYVTLDLEGFRSGSMNEEIQQ